MTHASKHQWWSEELPMRRTSDLQVRGIISASQGEWEAGASGESGPGWQQGKSVNMLEWVRAKPNGTREAHLIKTRKKRLKKYSGPSKGAKGSDYWNKKHSTKYNQVQKEQISEETLSFWRCWTLLNWRENQWKCILAGLDMCPRGDLKAKRVMLKNGGT